MEICLEKAQIFTLKIKTKNYFSFFVIEALLTMLMTCYFALAKSDFGLDKVAF